MTNDTPEALLAALATIVGGDHVITDADQRAYYSQDYFRKADPVSAVIRPQSIDQLARATAMATQAGYAIYPRGAGYSYTDAYLPTRAPGLTFDLTSLKRIVTINAQDMYVTAEAGCTWHDLDAALAPLGLRTPFWGPLSGRNATLGGAMSQGAISLGSSKYGTSADSVLGFEVVAADGTRVITGSAAQTGTSAFFRHYGPDLTGLFCNDAGALGLKATITLRLIARPRYVGGVSFAFSDFERVARGMAAVARLGMATESLGMSLGALLSATGHTTLMQDLKTLLNIVRSSASPWLGLSQAVRIALSGRRFINQAAAHSAHFAVEAHTLRELSGQLAAVRNAAKAFGVEITNTVPVAMRAQPFLPYDMLNMDGRRQLPLHGVFAFSRVTDFERAYQALLTTEADTLARYKIDVMSVYSGISTNGFLFEPVILWNDVAEVFHQRHSSAATLAKITAPEPNPQAQAAVSTLRDRIVEVMHAHGAIHMQIGKTYPYLRNRSPSHLDLVKLVKAKMDPKGLINPGALGLP